MRIVVDIRQQRPYEFQTPCETRSLQVGDYSLVGRQRLAPKYKTDLSLEKANRNGIVSSIDHPIAQLSASQEFT